MAVTITRTADLAGVATVANVATFSGASIGTASADRIIVVCVGSADGASATPNSATIDYGSGDTAMTAGSLAQFTTLCARLFYLSVPTGTTATIKVTYSGAVASADNHAAVYAVTGANATLSASGINTSTDMDSTAPLTTGSITIPSNGGFLALGCGAVNSNAKTWANATVDLEESGGSFLRFTTATRTTSGTVTVTCTGTVNGENGALAYVVFDQPSAIAGALVVTLDDVAISTSSALQIKANASVALDNVALSTSCVLQVKANSSVALDNATLITVGALSVAASLNVILDDISTVFTTHFEAPGSGKRKGFPSYIPQPAYEARKRPPFQPIWDRNRQVEQRRRELAHEAASRLPPPMPPAGIFATPQPVSYPQPTQFAPHQVARIAQQSRDAQDIADIQDVANVQSRDVSDIQDVSDIMTLIEGIE